MRRPLVALVAFLLLGTWQQHTIPSWKILKKHNKVLHNNSHTAHRILVSGFVNMSGMQVPGPYRVILNM
jgi:hypothetical protein